MLFYGLIPGLSLRSNPGLKLANAFGVYRKLVAPHRRSVAFGVGSGADFGYFILRNLPPSERAT